MKILYLYCHPCEESFHGAILPRALAGLERAGHTVDLMDLYAEGFDPILTAERRRAYHDLARNRDGLEDVVARLQAAEGLVLQFPTWCFGLPAMLKGFFDRVFMPGVAFDLSDPANVKPMLTHIRKIAGISTYGRPFWNAVLMADPPRRMVKRYLSLLAGGAPAQYHALYHMNVASLEKRKAFMMRVERAMEGF